MRARGQECHPPVAWANTVRMLGPVSHPIEIVPATVVELDALIDGDATFARRTGLRPVPGWCGFPDVVAGARAMLAAEIEPRWASHLVSHVADRALIGIAGYKGPPGGGEVEIGYALAPPYRGRGLATLVATTLVERARAAGVRTVLAHTLAGPNPSTRVLVRCGFTRVAEFDDPDDGPVWRWELGR